MLQIDSRDQTDIEWSERRRTIHLKKQVVRKTGGRKVVEISTVEGSRCGASFGILFCTVLKLPERCVSLGTSECKKTYNKIDPSRQC